MADSITHPSVLLFRVICSGQLLPNGLWTPEEDSGDGEANDTRPDLIPDRKDAGIGKEESRNQITDGGGQRVTPKGLRSSDSATLLTFGVNSLWIVFSH